MQTTGRIFWIIAELIWMGSLVAHWYVPDKIDVIYSLCLAIGLMLTSSRMIDDARRDGRR